MDLVPAYRFDNIAALNGFDCKQIPREAFCAEERQSAVKAQARVFVLVFIFVLVELGIVHFPFQFQLRLQQLIGLISLVILVVLKIK